MKQIPLTKGMIDELISEVSKIDTKKKSELILIVGLLQAIRDDCPIDYTLYLYMLNYLQNLSK